jgi:hypothetical protein
LGEPATELGAVELEIVAQRIEQRVSGAAGTLRIAPFTLRLTAICSP